MYYTFIKTTNNMKKQQSLSAMRIEAMSLRVSYIKEKDPSKGTMLLKSWSLVMWRVHDMQDEINKSLLSLLQYS